MALPKLYDLITWHNNTTPALNEDNLNAMSQAIDDIDDRVIDLAGTIMEDVPQIQEDMAILEPAIESIDDNVSRAEAAATDAETEQLKSEGYAVGEQNGVPVDSSSPYYHNNSKYYSTVASGSSAAHITYNNSDSHLAATNVQTAIDEVVGDLNDEITTRSTLGAKNLFEFPAIESLKALNTIGTWSGNAYTVSGVTFTVDVTTGQIFADGSAPSNDDPTIVLVRGNLASFSGLALWGFEQTSGYIQIEEVGGSWTRYARQNGGQRAIIDTIPSNLTSYMFVRITRNQTVDNITISPMMTLATDKDGTFQPYAETNKELTEDVKKINNGIHVSDTVGDFTTVRIFGDYSAATSIAAIETFIDGSANYVAKNFVVVNSSGQTQGVGMLYKFSGNWAGFFYTQYSTTKLIVGVKQSGTWSYREV